MVSKHEFDAHCDTLPYQEPPYHEQLAVMQEMKEAHETALKQQGAVEALQKITTTLSAFILRDSVEGDYFLGMHDALKIVKSNLDAMKGGVA
jgi:hypothetical protein